MTEAQNLTPLQKAAVALAALRARNEALEQAAHEPIAIVGLGCRYPAGATDPDALWQAVREGRDGAIEVPGERWDIDAVYDPTPGVPGKTYTRKGCFIDGVDRFDPLFFRISPREAVGIDPQQRLLLEVVWEALENAGIAPPSLVGSRTGVFLGISTNDYGALLSKSAHGSNSNASAGAGNAASVASGRISYTFGFQGPCMAVDTACSSSLVAAHLAVRALRGGECRIAIVAGVNLMLAPEITINFSQGRMLSPDGHCKTFDASADGYARGEGCGVLVLKRLADARADGDRIIALIRGSAVNQDGRSAGLTAPNGLAQEAVIRQALEDAKLAPGAMDYVEAHGTGTSLGDPIEMHALRAVFGTRADKPLRVGSVKTNIGHCEAAAGAAGLIKAALMLQHQAVPPTLHFRQLNPHIDLRGADIRVPTTLEPLPLAVVGVSSFGFSGTNAHLVLGAAPADAPAAPTATQEPPQLLITARSEAALRTLVARYRELLARPGVAWADVCHTAAAGRARFNWWVLADSPQALATAQPSNAPCPQIAVPAGRRIALPTYPFERERYWIDAPADSGSGPHPLLGEPLELPLASERRWSTRLDAQALDWMREHQVQGRAVVPGAAWIDTALVAAPDGMAVADLRLRAPLPMPAAGEALVLQTIAQDDGRFSIVSQRGRGAEPVLHATGQWTAADASAAPAPLQAAEPVDVQAVYAAMRARGVAHGPGFQRLRALHRQVDADQGAAEAVVDAGAAPLPWSRIHPAALDAAMQAVAAALPGDATDATLVPARIGQVVALRPLQGELRCQLQARRAGAGVEADLWLHDAQGLALHIRGLVFAPLRAQDGLGLHGLALVPVPLLGPGPWADMLAPLPAVQAVLASEAGRLAEAEGMAEYAGADGGMEALATQYIAEALIALGLPFETGETFTLRSMAETLGIATRHRRLFERMLAILAQDGVLSRRGTLWEATGEPELMSVDTLARELRTRHPAVAGELAVLQRCGAALAEVLQGRTDPLTLLFAAEDAGARTFYDGSPYARTVNGLLRAATAQLCADLPAARTLRVLEVGAGTGGATPAVMAGLPEGRWHYSFTDISAAFLPEAQRRFGGPQFATGLLDLEREPEEQGFAAGSFDLVVAANVVHATRDLRAVLRRVHRLLAPGGALLLVESTRPRRWVDIVFGLTEGWWRFEDADLRPDHPLLSQERWQALFAELGFDCCSAPAGEVFVARRPVAADPAAGIGQRWHVTGRAGSEAAASAADSARPLASPADLASQLHARGAVIDASGATHWVHLLPPTPPTLAGQQQLLHDLAEQVQHALRADPPPRLVWLAQAGLGHAGVAGLARTVAIEHPPLRLRLLVGAPDTRALVDEILADGPEQEVHWQQAQRCVPRLRAQAAPAPEAPLVQGGAWLITGGFGGLGQACARWLAERGAKRVVLFGRKAPATLPALRCEVAAVVGDVADEAQLARAFAHGPFEGILHAAGTLDDAPVVQQTPARIARVLAAKVGGALALDRLARAQPPRHFVLFSSVAGVTGSATQANHAFACSFLDGLAQARRDAGLPALSLDWGVWREIGEAARRGFDRRADELGLGSMAPATGIRALEAALPWRAAQCVVLPGVDWLRLASHFGAALPGVYADVVAQARADAQAAEADAARPAAAPGGTAPRAVAPSTGTAPPAQASRPAAAPGERIAAVVAAVLGLPANHDRQAPLYELGLDSLVAVEIRNRLQAELGLDVTVRELIEGASVAGLVERHASAVASAPATPPAATDDTAAQAEAARRAGLLEILREVLGLRQEPAGATPLYELGLDSLVAVEIRNRVEQRFGVLLTVRELIEGATVDQVLARLAQTPAVDASVAAATPQLPGDLPASAAAVPPPSPAPAPVPATSSAAGAPADRDAPFPLTDMQRAYWLGRRSDVELGNVGCYLYTEFDSAAVDLDRLEQAWNTLVARHEMLRVVILPDATQRILPQVPWYRFERLDLRGRDDAEAELLRLREQLARRQAEPGAWPLFDVRITLHGEVARIHTGFDLMALDAASIFALRQEWGRLYENPQLALPAIGFSFRDYVLAERALRGGPEWQRSEAYWSARAATLPGAPELPLQPEAAGPAGSPPRFVRHRVVLDAAQAAQLRSRARAHGLTLPTALAAAYADTLGAFSRSARFCLTVTTFSRRPLHADVGALLGDFTSTLLLEVDATAPAFAERAATLARRLAEDLDHSLVGGTHVLREVARRRGGGLQTVPVVFTSALGFRKAASLEAIASEAAGWDRLGTTVYNVSSTPQVWIDHQISEEDGQLFCHWDVLEAVFAPGVVARMVAAYQRLLLALVDGSGWQAPLTQAALADVARAPLLPPPAAPECLHAAFERQARATPGRTALIAHDGTLDYGTLDRASSHLAATLSARLGGPAGARDRLVAVGFAKGWRQIVGVLAVLKAGAAYLPLDPSLPAQRRDHLVRQGEALVLDDAALLDQALAEAQSGTDAPALPAIDDPSRLAYVIYTSGSTGEPKGVMIEHAAAHCTVAEINRRWGVSADDRVLALSALGFDLSVYDIFGLLAVGGALVLPEPQAARDPSRWSELLVAHRVTLWNTVPALMAMQVEYGLPPAHALRLVMMSGDWVPLELVARLRTVAPQARLVALGGATEAGIWSNAHEIGALDAAWPSIPYGLPLAGHLLHVANAQGEDVPDLVTGEIEISGHGLARGYWRDADRTAQRFRTDRAGRRRYRTGDLGRFRAYATAAAAEATPIEFLGREDTQVKVQGYRIELGEIEAALGAHPAVAAAVVAVSGGAARTLHGFVVPRAAADAGDAAWHRALDAAQSAAASAPPLPAARFDAAAEHLSRHAVAVAARALAGLRGPMEADALIASGQVAPRYRRWLGRMLPRLAQAGAAADVPSLDALAELDQLGFAPAQFALLEQVAARLPDILAERMHSSEIYLSDDTPQVYARLFAQPNAAIARLLATLAEDRPLSVLEVGGGLGTTLAAIAPALPAGRVRYHFTDLSPHMVARARRLFAEVPGIGFGAFDFDGDPPPPAEPHDLVLASSALHAAADVRHTLVVLRRQLRPGGALVLLEQTRFFPWFDLNMGLQAGFDSRTDTALRPAHPLLSREAWATLLREAGFGEVRLLAAEGTLADRLGLDVLVARVPATAPVAQDDPALVPALFDWLRERLPGYMVPATLQCVAALPLSSNGKVDRQQLLPLLQARPFAAGGETTPPLQRALAALVRELLPAAGEDVDRSLFELGATSLTLVSLHRLIGERLGRRLPLQVLFETPTIGSLARALAQAGGPQAPVAAPPLPSPGPAAGADARFLTDPAQRDAYKRSRPGLRPPTPGALRVALPAVSAPTPPSPVPHRASTRDFARAPLQLPALAALLDGLLARVDGDQAHYLYPSAGGAYCVQVWVQAKPGGVDGLEPAFYALDPLQRALERVAPDVPAADALHLPPNRAAYQGCGCAIYLVAAVDAMEPLYGAQSRDMCLLEAGHMGQLLDEAATRHGIGLCPVGHVNTAALPADMGIAAGRPLVYSFLAGLPAGPEARKVGSHLADAPMVATAARPGPADAVVLFAPRRPDKPLLWAMPGVLALPFYLRGLAEAVAPQADLATVQLPGLFDDQPVLDAMGAQADFVLRAMRRAQPQGPYRICGLSYGGYVAVEVARRLRAEGQSVPMLVLGDTVRTFTTLDAFQDEDVARLALARALLALYGRHLDTPMDTLLALPGRAMLQQVAEALQRTGVIGAGGLPTERLLTLFRANFRALGRYQPEPLPGDLTLVRTDDGFPPEFGEHEDAAVLADPGLGWGPLVQGTLHGVRMPGGHLTMLEGESLRVLAALLADRVMHASREGFDGNP